MTAEANATCALPSYLLDAHNLCVRHHDLLLEILRTWDEEPAFNSQSFDLHDAEAPPDEAEDVFDWLDRTGRKDERNKLIRRSVLPAVLSDFLQFISEALSASEKGRITVAYALVRKPIQETLFLLEAMALDPDLFAHHIANNPIDLRHRRRTLDDHEARISGVLGLIGETDRFDAAYLARLRYEISADDGFDGICNRAVHLFTEHRAIRTPAFDVNFVFVDPNDELAPWYFLYSRLPYLLSYAWRLLEHLCLEFAQADPGYLKDMGRRIAAATILWWPNVDASSKPLPLLQFVQATAKRLTTECVAAGYRAPRMGDLPRMRDSGAFPDEPLIRVHSRNANYAVQAWMRRALRAVDRGLDAFEDAADAFTGGRR